MDMFSELEDLICEKVDEVVKTKDINPTQMECIKNAMKTLYYAEVIEAMRNRSEDEYSNGMSYENSYARRGRSRGMSYANTGNSNRRMSRAYSGHTKEQLMQQIAELQREVEMMN